MAIGGCWRHTFRRLRRPGKVSWSGAGDERLAEAVAVCVEAADAHDTELTSPEGPLFRALVPGTSTAACQVPRIRL
jgi:hypothetical protein